MPPFMWKRCIIHFTFKNAPRSKAKLSRTLRKKTRFPLWLGAVGSAFASGKRKDSAQWGYAWEDGSCVVAEQNAETKRGGRA